jgi:glycosyltransferase involved in cell wall biosynthesis
LKEFVRLGVSAAAISPRGFLHDPKFPLPAGVVEVPAAEARGAPEPRVGLAFLHPPLLGRVIGRTRVNLFVWESDALPAGWAELLGRGAHVVVVPSAFTRDALVRSGFPANRCALVPYGFDESFLPAAGADAPARPFTFLAVMAPHRRKGARELLAAYRNAFTARDDVLLRVKSTYDPATDRRPRPFEIPSWREILREHGLSDPGAPPVELDTRILDDETAMGLFAGADVVVAPSWGESFGLAILEAMAAGKPVIATGWGGHMDYFPPGPDALPYRLADAGESLYEPAPGAHAALPDVDALVERMRWHRRHAAESRALGVDCARRVAHLTWARSATSLLDVVRSASDRTS